MNSPQKNKPAGSKKVAAIIATVAVGIIAFVAVAVAMQRNDESEKEKTQMLNMVEDGARNPRTKVVLTTRSIRAGALIEPEDVEEKEVLNNECPDYALTSSSLAAGSHAAVDIPAGTTMLSKHLKHGQ